jgi:hypothetical protein
MQRPLPDNTPHSEEKYIHVSVGIRIRNPIRGEAPDPRLRWASTGIGISKSIERRMIELRINDKLENNWKKPVIP